MANNDWRHMGHRQGFLTRRKVLLGIVGVIAAAAFGPEDHAGRPSLPPAPPPAGGAFPIPSTTTPSPDLSTATPIDYDQPGPPEVIFGDDPDAGTFALTFDDGTCATCAAEIVAGVKRHELDSGGDTKMTVALWVPP